MANSRNSGDLGEAKESLVSNPHNGEGKVVWTQRPNGLFSINLAWNEFRLRKPKVNWHCLVWHKKNIPRHSIILWLVIRGRLITRDKLQRYGITNSARCVLCNDCDESPDQLYFQCPFSNFIWSKILEPNLLSYRAQDWDGYIDRIAKEWKGEGLVQTNTLEDGLGR